MEKHTIKASKRTVTGHKVKKLRRDGILPANLYGKKIKSLALQVEEKEFSKVFALSGETAIVEVVLEAKKLPVLIHNVQYHPVKGIPLHADFYQVDLKEKVTTNIPLILVGEAKAVKDKLGVVLQLLSELEVEALPADLTERIEVDVSSLSNIDESIKVDGLKVSDKIKILTTHNLEVVKIAPLVSKEAEQMVAEETAKAVAVTEETAVKEEELTKEKPETTQTPKQETVKPEEKQKAK